MKFEDKKKKLCRTSVLNQDKCQKNKDRHRQRKYLNWITNKKEHRKIAQVLLEKLLKKLHNLITIPSRTSLKYQSYSQATQQISHRDFPHVYPYIDFLPRIHLMKLAAPPLT